VTLGSTADKWRQWLPAASSNVLKHLVTRGFSLRRTSPSSAQHLHARRRAPIRRRRRVAATADALIPAVLSHWEHPALTLSRRIVPKCPLSGLALLGRASSKVMPILGGRTWAFVQEVVSPAREFP
jgi:hypothetical protein